jgi:hypothetical protein
MKLRMHTLRSLIREEFSMARKKAEIQLITDDMKKRVIQAFISGDIQDEKDLERYYTFVENAFVDLKSIPFDEYKRQAKK